MVDRAKLLQRLMATFLDELDEHVQTIGDGVLALEKGLPEEELAERLAAMFRAAHSLKGASRAVDQEPIEQLCHTLEDVFGAIRDGRMSLEGELCTLILKTADAIGSAGQALRAKDPLNTKLLGEFRSTVQAAAAGDSFEIPQLAVSEPASAPAAVSAEQPAEPPAPPAPPQTTSTDPAPVTSREPPSTASPDPPVPGRSTPSGTVRVAQEKLDLLLARSGELLVARQRMDTHPAEIEALLDAVSEWKQEWQSAQRTLVRMIEGASSDPLVARSTRYASRLTGIVETNGERLRILEQTLDRFRRSTQSDARQLNVIGSSLQDEVHNIRMVPFEQACAGLQRSVRDIATASGKNVQLVLEGGDIEVDRSVISGLTDPLMHLVRNAVDHGIEQPADRKAAGKSPRASVTVSASLRGSQVEVVVSDDGRGLNLERIRNRVRSRNLPEPSDDRELVNCIFLPGFSTAEIITDVSGRGIGMDVVKSQVESLRGTIETASQPGFGTRFTLLVPLTLTTINAVFVRLGEQTFLMPSANVRKLVRFLHSEIQSMQGQETLPLQGAPLPVISLSELLGRGIQVSPTESGHLTGVVVTVGGRDAVFVVDEVSSEREIVIKNLGARIHRLPHVSGATLLQSGEIALLLNVPSLLRKLSAGVQTGSLASAAGPESTHVETQRVLVVDDSVTTRTLIRSILETAGYDVDAAIDGQDAWERMQSASSPYEIVVTDVDMPRMDGFRLTEVIRSSSQYEETPIVLVTSRDAEEDKIRGVDSGANAYLVKSQFDQSNILETIQQLI